MRLDRRTIFGACVTAVLCGCGASVDQLQPGGGSDRRPTIGGGYGSSAGAVAAREATASQVTFHGWKALQLTNGLVTVTIVPDLGGRIMEYNLGEHPFLWTNPDEYGKLYEAPRTASERKWHNFGGYKVWPSPQSQWGGPPDPLGSMLDGGRWTAKVLKASGDAATVELTSPSDAEVTGLQMVRRVILRAGTTEVEVRETFRNVSPREITWSIWDVTQVPGALRGDGQPSREARVYLPLNPKSLFQGGYRHIIADPTDQWTVINDGMLLQTSYGGQTGKIGADSLDGWIAYVDELHKMAYAKIFEVTAGATYPDQGSTVEVYTSQAATPYMEVEVLSPLQKLAPGAEMSFTEHWYCAQTGGPLVKVGPLAAIKTFPVARWKDKEVTVTGELGVFAPGLLALDFRGEAGPLPAATTPAVTQRVSPASAVSLKLSAEAPAGATKVALVLKGNNGQALGTIAELPLGTSQGNGSAAPVAHP